MSIFLGTLSYPSLFEARPVQGVGCFRRTLLSEATESCHRRWERAVPDGWLVALHRGFGGFGSKRSAGTRPLESWSRSLTEKLYKNNMCVPCCGSFGYRCAFWCWSQSCDSPWAWNLTASTSLDQLAVFEFWSHGKARLLGLEENRHRLQIDKNQESFANTQKYDKTYIKI